MLLFRHRGVFLNRCETYNAPLFSSEELLEAFPLMCASSFLNDLAISSMFLMTAVSKNARNMTLVVARAVGAGLR